MVIRIAFFQEDFDGVCEADFVFVDVMTSVVVSLRFLSRPGFYPIRERITSFSLSFMLAT
jgi:hypothetical protein